MEGLTFVKLISTPSHYAPNGTFDIQVFLVNENLICLKDVPDLFVEELEERTGPILVMDDYIYLPLDVYNASEIEAFLTSEE